VSRYCFAINDANSGSSANAKKIGAGSATSRLGRNRSALLAAASAVPVISTSLYRKQAGRPYVEHDRHQHAIARPAMRAREGWPMRQASIVHIAAPQRNVRTSQSSGKKERSSAVFKYPTPEDPPVPGL